MDTDQERCNIECPTCDGRGWNRWVDPSMPPPLDRTLEDCPDCKGTGRVTDQPIPESGKGE